jgi:hypothetical protein
MSLLVAPDDVKEQVRSGEMAEKEARRRTSKARRRAETVAAAQAIAAQPLEVPVTVFATIVVDGAKAPLRRRSRLTGRFACGPTMGALPGTANRFGDG